MLYHLIILLVNHAVVLIGVWRSGFGLILLEPYIYFRGQRAGRLAC